jgi:hypothetical protein
MSHTTHLVVVDRHRLQHAEVDQPGLLEAGDDLDVDADLPGPLDERAPVLGLAHGGCGDGPHLRAVDGGDLAEPVQGLDAALHGRRREPLHVGGRGAEADHLAFAVDHVDAVLAHPRHDQVDRVRTDVHGREDVVHSSYSGLCAAR